MVQCCTATLLLLLLYIAADSQAAASSEKLQQLKSTVKRLKDQVSDMTADVTAQMSGMTAQVLDITVQNTNLTAQMTEMTTQVLDITAQNTNLTDHMTDFTAQVLDITAQNTNLMAHNTYMTAQNTNLMAHNTYMTGQISDLTDHVLDITVQNTKLTAQMTDLTAQMTDLTAQMLDITAQNTNLTAHNTNMTTQMTDLKAQNTNMTAQMTDMTAQLSDLTAQNTNMTAHNTNLTAQVAWINEQPGFKQWVDENQFAEMAVRMSRMEEQQEQCSCLPKGVSNACPSGYVEVGKKCLLFSEASINYTEAKNDCLEAGGQLAILDNCNVLHGIASYLDNDVLSNYWIGATDVAENGNWMWSDGKDVDMGATFWGRTISGGTFEPNGGVAENCLLMHTGYNYRFGDSSCTDHIGKSPLCQYNDDTCSSPRVLLGGRCLEFLSDLELDWSGAGAKCIENGGNFAKVDDCNLLGAISAYLLLNSGLAPTEGYWIDGGDSAEEGKWLWLDGTPVPMGAPYWDQDKENTNIEPNNSGYCAKMRGDTRWMLDDTSCSNKGSPICEAPHIITY